MMYCPIDNEDGRWRVDFIAGGNDPLTIGYALTKDAACRIAGAMNGGDMDRVQGVWDYFINGAPVETPAPVIVDMLNEPPQLRSK